MCPDRAYLTGALVGAMLKAGLAVDTETEEVDGARMIRPMLTIHVNERISVRVMVLPPETAAMADR